MALTFDDIQSHKYNYAFLAACVFLVLKFLIQSLLSPLRRVPGPFLARFTRLWEVYANHRCDFATYNIALHQRYGTFHDHPCSAQTTIGFVIAKKKKDLFETDTQAGPIVRLAPNRYSINDQDSIKMILGHSSHMPKAQYYHTFGKHDQTNLFSETNQAMHSKMRRPISQLYSTTHLLSYEAQIDKCNAVLLKSLRESVRKSEAIDFREWAQFYAFDVIGEISVRVGYRPKTPSREC